LASVAGLGEEGVPVGTDTENRKDNNKCDDERHRESVKRRDTGFAQSQKDGLYPSRRRHYEVGVFVLDIIYRISRMVLAKWDRMLA
jgi:hypothetical protein